LDLVLYGHVTTGEHIVGISMGPVGMGAMGLNLWEYKWEWEFSQQEWEDFVF